MAREEKAKIILYLGEEDAKWCVADEDIALSNCYTARLVENGREECGKAYIAAITYTPESSLVEKLVVVFKRDDANNYEAFDLDEVDVIIANTCDEEE